MKKIISLLLACVLILLTATTTFAAEDSTEATNGLGFNSGTADFGSFDVYLSSDGSTGQITVRITSPDQNCPVYLKVTDPNGRVVWSRYSYSPFNGLYPENGKEHKSPQFSKAVAGNYTISWGSMVDVTIDCWVYNW